MSIKKIFRLVAAMFVLGCFFTSCNDIVTNNNENGISTVTFNLKQGSARTVNPDYVLSNLTDLEISYKKSGESSTTVIVSGKKYSDLDAGKIKAILEYGTYNFYATAKISGRNYSATVENKTISSLKDTVSFTLIGGDFAANTGSGYINIAFTIADTNVRSVKATLYNYADSSVKLEATPLALDKTDPAAITCAYKVNADANAVASEIESGTYRLVVDFYSDDSAMVKIGTYREIVNVADNIVSTASRSIGQLNKTYTISYNLNGGDFANGVTAPEYASLLTEALTLPTASQMKKEFAVFSGWYEKSDFSGDAVTSLSDISSDVTLYAKWSTYLVFQGNDKFTLGINTTESGKKAWDGHLYYSTDTLTWTEWNKDDDSVITSSEAVDGKAYVYLKGNNTALAKWVNNGDMEWLVSTILEFSGSATQISCYGNIMSLLEDVKPNEAEMGEDCFSSLFYNCNKLVKAPDLPAMKLSYNCYKSMFSECTALVDVPDLPAETMASRCYLRMFNGCTSLVNAPAIAAKTLDDSAFYSMFSDCTSLVTAPDLDAETLAPSCYEYMFSGCTSLENAPDLPAETLEKSCYEHMFENCTSLKNAPVISAKTMVYRSCAFMFQNCSALTTIGKIGDGSPVTFESSSMIYMFDRCSNIKVSESDSAADATRFVTIGTTSASDVFTDCKAGSLVNLEAGKSYKYIVPIAITGDVEISGELLTGETLTATYTPGATGETVSYQWYTVEGSTETKISGATNATYLLTNSEVDKIVKVVATGSGDYYGSVEATVKKFVAVPTYNVKWVFSDVFDDGTNSVYDKAKTAKSIIIGKKSTYATAVAGLDAVHCGETSTDKVYAYFDSTTDAETLYVLANEKIVFNDDDRRGRYTSIFTDCSNVTNLVLDNIDTSNMTDMSYMFDGMGKITSLDLSSFDTSNVTTMEGMFSSTSLLEAIDVSGFNTSKVTNMASMFYFSSKLTSIDLSNFDFTNVTSMSGMLFYCSALKSVNFGSNFIGANVQDISYIFAYCGELESVNLSNFVTTSLENARSMFDHCGKLNNVTFGSGFTCENVTTMEGMFYLCQALTSINISSVNTLSLTNTKNMFMNCEALTELKLGDNFNTSKVTDMNGMFCNLIALSSLNLSGFVTSNVTDMAFMFYGSKALKVIDLSSFDTKKVTAMNSMFKYAEPTTIDLSSFDTTNVTDVTDMFAGVTATVYYSDSITKGTPFAGCTTNAKFGMAGTLTWVKKEK